MYACPSCNDSYCAGCAEPEEMEAVTRTCRVCKKEFQGSEMDCFCSGACVMADSKAYWDAYNGTLTAASAYVEALTARCEIRRGIEGGRAAHLILGSLAPVRRAVA